MAGAVVLGEAARHLWLIGGIAERTGRAGRVAAASVSAFPWSVRVLLADPQTAVAAPADYAERSDHHRVMGLRAVIIGTTVGSPAKALLNTT